MANWKKSTEPDLQRRIFKQPSPGVRQRLAPVGSAIIGFAGVAACLDAAGPVDRWLAQRLRSFPDFRRGHAGEESSVQGDVFSGILISLQ
ncbi:hypothetical protein FJ951_13490 [Mesorhizobium sp. B2-2-3]|uniref:hypothetical protein n=1 Tax=Mesorhizobium sp. B2-2-3 TaxID=2589963 RepID=UPI001128F385|nr:hypothetical protein [Mesorhizobium sp. B2-2-3]TPM47373.1 hypothetical protein FJ951_13490 [Mesorhizobium sp. B2-2-3]